MKTLFFSLAAVAPFLFTGCLVEERTVHHHDRGYHGDRYQEDRVVYRDGDRRGDRRYDNGYRGSTRRSDTVVVRPGATRVYTY